MCQYPLYMSRCFTILEIRVLLDKPGPIPHPPPPCKMKELNSNMSQAPLSPKIIAH